MSRDLANWLFNPAGLTAHGACPQQAPWLIWLHGTSDLATGLACLAILLSLTGLIRRRPDRLSRPVVALFAGCILLCGCSHLMALWVPLYALHGVIEAMAAIAALAAAVLVRVMMPRLLAMPSPAQWRQARIDLNELRLAEARMAAIAAQASHARDALAGELSRRVLAERSLKESEERLQLLMQSNVTDALVLISPGGDVETWNTAAQRNYGYSTSEIIGRPYATFFTAEDVAAGEPARILAVAQEQGRYSGEAWRLRRDGMRFLARVSIDAIRRRDGALRGFVKVTQDITAQRIEEAQRTIIIEAAPNGMIIVNEAGIITLANAQVARMFGLEEGTLAGQPVDTLIPPDAGDAYAVLTAVRVDGDASAAAPARPFSVRRRDGQTIIIDLMARPVQTPRGHIVVASLFDVTDRVREAEARREAEHSERLAAAAANATLDQLSRDLARARDRAEQANEAKSRFLAGITHELRTPLHGLLGYAEMLMLEGGLSPKQSERVETMMAAGQHLLSMVNDVLDMSQIEADRLELQLAEVELPDLIRVCLDVVRPTAEAKGLAIGQAPGARLRVVADPMRLRQVLINLLGNAVKFTPAGHVDVRVSNAQDGRFVRLEVVDTGPGVHAAHRDKLFKTFERLNAAAMSGIEGSGLGLAISARLVGLMGGEIGYDDNPGGGSVFWLELPASQGGGAAGALPLACPPPADGPRLRLLVADDEVLNRSIASGFLTMAGHEVVCVDSGAAAVEAAAALDFDAILMDVRMPGMNGMEATRRIRALPGPRGRVRIVAVTAQAFTQQIEMCRRAGMDGHLAKPFKQATLLAALRPYEAAAADRGGTAALPAEAVVPVFDRAMFQDTFQFLPARDVTAHLRTLQTRCEALLRQLRSPEAIATDTLIEDVHKLAGSAGMFGFLAMSAASRAFEFAAGADGEDLPALGRHLEHIVEETLAVLRAEINDP
jgi:PAS domain S-box-containing protein